MTIECYFDDCPYHESAVTGDIDAGPFCTEHSCVATDRELTLYMRARKKVLAKVYNENDATCALETVAWYCYGSRVLWRRVLRGWAGGAYRKILQPTLP